MGSLPNMDVSLENIVRGSRTRSRTERYVHPDEVKVCQGVYRDEALDEAAEAAGQVFQPINADCAESGEEESDGESDGDLPSIIDDTDTSPNGSYVPSEYDEEDDDDDISSESESSGDEEEEEEEDDDDDELW
tara:strand:+ start:465 stop:863 length:399 start_codon:yes stop_codon:yes gene_type:complete